MTHGCNPRARGAKAWGGPQIQGQSGLPEALPLRTSKQMNKNKNKKNENRMNALRMQALTALPHPSWALPCQSRPCAGQRPAEQTGPLSHRPCFIQFAVKTWQYFTWNTIATIAVNYLLLLPWPNKVLSLERRLAVRSVHTGALCQIASEWPMVEPPSVSQVALWRDHKKKKFQPSQMTSLFCYTVTAW